MHDRNPVAFDADAYFRGGGMPWTFFAFRSDRVDPDGFPPDADARRYLEAVQAEGIRASVWRATPLPHTCYFACHRDDIERVLELVAALEDGVRFPKSFGTDRSASLMEPD